MDALTTRIIVQTADNRGPLLSCLWHRFTDHFRHRLTRSAPDRTHCPGMSTRAVLLELMRDSSASEKLYCARARPHATAPRESLPKRTTETRGHA